MAALTLADRPVTLVLPRLEHPLLQFLRIALYVVVAFAILSALFPAARQRADRLMRSVALVLLISTAIFIALHLMHLL
ncbi:hypothetical protein JCM19000A_16570 [Silvimonas sp. JCM 19000]